MHLLKGIRKDSELWLLLLAIIFRLLLLNFNSAEWGDTYRILRAAELSRTEFYPQDEKRPPLLSLLISFHPNNMDPLLFGRYVLAFFSVISLILFYIYLKKYIKTTEYRIIGLLLFLFNPIYLYWSLRVYADVVFSVYVLFVGVLIHQASLLSNKKYLMLLGFITAFSITLRFEGYILIASLLLFIFFKDYPKLNIKNAVIASIGVASVVFPYIIFRNPLNSSYLDEPAGRTYNLMTLWVYFVSLFYSLGVIYAPAVLIISRKVIMRFLYNNLFILFFLSLSLVLILLWPAAIPRLFVSAIPFLILSFVISLESLKNIKINKQMFVIVGITLIGLFAFSQFILKLQFLLVIKWVFALVIIVNLVSLFLYYVDKKVYSYVLIVISCIIWSLATLYIHKDIYKSLADASQYLARNGKGLVIHNDINSVAEWYINYYPYRKWSMKSDFENIKLNPSVLNPTNLKSYNVRFVLVTNEQDPSWWPDLSKKPYLEEIKLFRYNVNGSTFTTAVYKVRSEYL